VPENLLVDPINYVTAPSISWDAMLKYTNANLELISDGDNKNCLKRAKRGGGEMYPKNFYS